MKRKRERLVLCAVCDSEDPCEMAGVTRKARPCRKRVGGNTAIVPGKQGKDAVPEMC
jgi:hypothetical protein